MLSVLTQSISNASFGIYFPKFTGTIYELLSAPISHLEIVLSYVGAAATKSVLVGLIILATASVFVPLHIAHPVWMLAFLVLTAVTFSLFGFIIGIWADGFEKLQLIPMLIVMPLTFLGGPFYSIDMLPPVWQKLSLLNPSVYLISGLSLELLRQVGDARRHQLLDDGGVLRRLAADRDLDHAQRLASQDLARAEPAPRRGSGGEPGVDLIVVARRRAASRVGGDPGLRFVQGLPAHVVGVVGPAHAARNDVVDHVSRAIAQPCVVGRARMEALEIGLCRRRSPVGRPRTAARRPAATAATTTARASGELFSLRAASWS